MVKITIILLLMITVQANAESKKLPNPTPKQMIIIYKKLSEMRKIERQTLGLWKWTHTNTKKTN